jgi:hypothetical protein
MQYVGSGLKVFDICLNIDSSGQFSVCANITLRPSLSVSQLNPFVCHWLEAADVCLAFIHRKRVLGEKGDTRESYKKKSDSLKKHIREFPDMIMHVGHDGSLLVWGINVSYS